MLSVDNMFSADNMMVSDNMLSYFFSLKLDTLELRKECGPKKRLATK
jgi:hypothetical protein